MLVNQTRYRAHVGLGFVVYDDDDDGKEQQQKMKIKCKIEKLNDDRYQMKFIS